MYIALLEDDPDQSVLIQSWLEEGGHKCSVFSSGVEITRAIHNKSYDVLILDWLVPDMDGLEVLDRVRENLDWRIPILFITQRDSEGHIVEALQHGADDYMSKPVKKAEMLARVSAISHRTQSKHENEEILKFPPYTLNLASRTLQLAGETLDITHKEFELSLFFFKHRGRVLSRGYILETVWGKSADLNTRTVDTHISRLRRKLSLAPANGWRLSSIYQHGYRLEQCDETSSDNSENSPSNDN
jgi:DNA-binding response OmpR family regulator